MKTASFDKSGRALYTDPSDESWAAHQCLDIARQNAVVYGDVRIVLEVEDCRWTWEAS